MLNVSNSTESVMETLFFRKLEYDCALTNNPVNINNMNSINCLSFIYFKSNITIDS